MASRLSATDRTYRDWVEIDQIPAPEQMPDPAGIDTLSLEGVYGGLDEVAFCAVNLTLIDDGVTIKTEGGDLYDTPGARLLQQVRALAY